MPNRIVLVVEDDPNDEHLTLRAIRQHVHCSVIVAHSAAEALGFLTRTGPFDNRSGPNPTAIFLDNALPGFGGADLVAEIRKQPSLRTIPIIILSGSSDCNVVEKCHRAGANSFLEKPLEMSDYLAHVGHAAHYWLNINLLPNSITTNISLL
jgi:two-component system response regulator